jgi:hypothetical protein
MLREAIHQANNQAAALMAHLLEHPELGVLRPPVERIIEEGMVQGDAVAGLITRFEELMTSVKMQKDYMNGLLDTIRDNFLNENLDGLNEAGRLHARAGLQAATMIRKWSDTADRIRDLLRATMKLDKGAI